MMRLLERQGSNISNLITDISSGGQAISESLGTYITQHYLIHKTLKTLWNPAPHTRGPMTQGNASAVGDR